MKNTSKRSTQVGLCPSRIIFLSLAIFLVWTVEGQSIERRIGNNQNKLNIRITLPEDFQPDKPYPVLLAPGFEATGEPYSLYIGDRPEQFDWIIVESVVNINAKLVVDLVNYLKSEYTVSDVFISGFSANSVPMFSIVSRHPTLFDGVIAMPGYANNIDVGTYEVAPDLRIILIVGEKDFSWKGQASSAHARLKEIGFNSSLHIIPGLGHKMDAFAGEPFFTLLNEMLNL